MSDNKPVMSSISDALGMAPLIIDAEIVPVTEESSVSVVVEPAEMSIIDQQAEEDFALARKNSQELLEQAKEALDGILRIAAGSEHPRAFEVAANLLKTASDLNAGLLKLHEARRQLVPDPDGGKKDTPTTVNNTQNNNYYGSTQDLLDAMDERDRLEKERLSDAS